MYNIFTENPTILYIVFVLFLKIVLTIAIIDI